MGEVRIRGTDYSDIGFLRLGRAHLDEFSILQHPEQQGLGFFRQLSYFIQEKRAPVGFLEITLSGGYSPREGAFFVSE